MSKFELKYPPGATPLDPNELDGLIPDYISTQSELNKLEKANILEATTWAQGRSHKNILDVSFVYSLHKKMFANVWRWAGTQRRSDKNIGVNWAQISTRLVQLLDDVKYWIKDGNVYSWDEIGARFHYRLVAIHVFPNGNGRHARLLTDILMQSNGQEPFTWGLKPDDSLDVEGTLRNEYIASLQAADGKDYSRLIKFARS